MTSRVLRSASLCSTTLATATSTPVLPMRWGAGSTVPPSPEAYPEELHRLLEQFVSQRRNITLVTGAGCSTESGIPDYRSPNGAYSKGHKPVTYADFTKVEAVRRRYWARSFTGWGVFSSVKPNRTHYGITALQQAGYVSNIITQNVDRLHHKSHGSRVIELHGSQFTVSCLTCKHQVSREDFQHSLADMNPSWVVSPEVVSFKNDPFTTPATTNSTTRPDGDSEIVTRDDYQNFHLPCCPCCGGVMKPDVVFFGQNVPTSVVDEAFDVVAKSDGIIAAGTSLQVYSVYRFIVAAARQNVPVVIVNVGPTRADEQALLHIPAITGETFERLGRCFAPVHYNDLLRKPLLQPN